MADFKGFTFIELILTVAIVAILMSIALPAYQDFTIRSKVTEGLVLASDAKIAVADAFSRLLSGHILPYAGLGFGGYGSYSYNFTPTEYVSRIKIMGIANLTQPAIDEGRIEIIFVDQINNNLGSALVLTPGAGILNGARPTQPLALGKTIIWGCGVSLAKAYKYVPVNCRHLL